MRRISYISFKQLMVIETLRNRARYALIYVTSASNS